jgi:uncharacterized membrane protein
MNKNRVEAFSDGVLAIIITIMVLELKQPAGTDWASPQRLMPVLSRYVLSFIYVGIYWNNHHHLFHAAHRVSAGVLWANLHLLFWLSLLPFATAWLGEGHFQPIPTAFYGTVLLLAAIAYVILQGTLVASEGRNSTLARALGRDWKGKLSPVIYLAAIFLSFHTPWMANALYAFAAMLWLAPDRRIERALRGGEGAS